MHFYVGEHLTLNGKEITFVDLITIYMKDMVNVKLTVDPHWVKRA